MASVEGGAAVRGSRLADWRRLGLALLVWGVLAGFGSAATAAPSVQVLNGARPGSLEIRGTGAVDLAPELRVERQRSDGVFEPVRNLDLSSMRVVAACGQPAGTCVRVDGRGLRPPPWSGMSCASQCNRTCDKNVRLQGRFRFVVTSCDGRARYEGPVFRLPESR